MRAHRGFYVAAAIGAATLALTACSGEEKSEEKKSTTTIASIMGVPDYATIDYDAQQRAIEEEIATCMREEGWEYIPVEYPDMGGDFGEYTDEDELKRIEREGFGVVYWTLNSYGEDGSYEDPWATWEDPNQEYVEALSDSERDAYYEALWGVYEEVPIDSEGDMAIETLEPAPVDPESAGCYDKAQRAVSGDDPSMNPEFWDLMDPFYQDLNARFESDPRVTELNAKWASCMKDEGYDFEDQNEFYDWVFTDFDSRQQEILGDDFYADPFEGWAQEDIDNFYENASQDELDKMFETPELTSAQRAALEELLAEEIDVAKKFHKCNENIDDKMGELYQEIEEKFALEHEDELRAIAASLNGSK